jgi:hypothetical protein
VGCLFTFLFPLLCSSFLVSICLFLLLFSELLRKYTRNLCSYQCHKTIIFWFFFSSSFIISGLMLKFCIYVGCFLYIDQDQQGSGYLFYSAPFIEEIHLSLLCVLCTFLEKSIGYKWVLISGLSIQFQWLMFLF